MSQQRLPLSLAMWGPLPGHILSTPKNTQIYKIYISEVQSRSKNNTSHMTKIMTPAKPNRFNQTKPIQVYEVLSTLNRQSCYLTQQPDSSKRVL